MKKSDKYKKEIEKLMEEFYGDCIELNDFMAKNPELSGVEYNASKQMVELLRKEGIETEYPFSGLETAFKASINEHKKNGPRVAILVEYDALPDIGHGCGHSASGTISILSALLLNRFRNEFDGRIDIIGTPDEEVMGGKITMAKNGVFDDYDYAIMMHIFNDNSTYSKFLSLDGIKVEFHGKTSHASASPWEGINALNAVQLFFHSIDMMRQHVKTDVRIHGIIKEGGKAPNIVPDYSLAEVYTRGLDRAYLDDISEWVRDCARAAALATKTTVNIEALCPSLKGLYRNRAAESILEDCYESCNLKVNEKIDALGSSDIGELNDYCPTFHTLICLKEDIELHTKEVAEEMVTDIGHNAIMNGARIISSFVLETLLDEKLLDKIKIEYQENKKTKMVKI
jgi:amidohydrolase